MGPSVHPPGLQPWIINAELRVNYPWFNRRKKGGVIGRHGLALGGPSLPEHAGPPPDMCESSLGPGPVELMRPQMRIGMPPTLGTVQQCAYHGKMQESGVGRSHRFCVWNLLCRGEGSTKLPCLVRRSPVGEVQQRGGGGFEVEGVMGGDPSWAPWTGRRIGGYGTGRRLVCCPSPICGPPPGRTGSGLL